MFNLSSLVTSWSARRGATAHDAHSVAATFSETSSALDAPAVHFSQQDMQACDALLDEFLESMSGDISLIDLACYTESLPLSKVT